MDIRPATIEDAHHFVRVFELASEGLATYFWQQFAGADQDPRDFGYERVCKRLRDPANSSIVAVSNNEVCGGLISYDIGTVPEPIAPDSDPHVVPLIELENLAPLTHYVNVLAVFPGSEGRGIATALLDHAAQNAAPRHLSLIVDDVNLRAVKLYERLGFLAKASRPMVKQGWNGPGENYALMKKAA